MSPSPYAEVHLASAALGPGPGECSPLRLQAMSAPISATSIQSCSDYG